ncbi:MAG: hypothetical protein ACRCUS_05015, partial [Anaerovoracaceae bacterium]
VIKDGKVTITGNLDGVELYTEGTYKDGKIKTSGFLGNGAAGYFSSGEGTEAMVAFAIKMAKGRNSHGYSQKNRTCSLCRNSANDDYDCSSFVTAALAHSNMGSDFKKACKDTWPYTTFNFGPALKKYGFKNLGKLPPSKCKRGDILLNPATHVEIAIGGGMSVGARNDTDGSAGETRDNEIYIQNISFYPFWTEVWRKGN